MTCFLQLWHISPSGAAQEIQSAQIGTIKDGGYDWLHIDALNPESKTWLSEIKDIDASSRDGLLEGDSRPRVIPHDDLILINLRGANLNDGGDVTDMVGIRFILNGSRVISAERRPLKTTRAMVEAIRAGHGPKTTGTFIAQFAIMLTERLGPAMISLDDEVTSLEDNVEVKDLSETRTRLTRQRQDIISLRRYLVPQRDALNYMTVQPVTWMADLDRLLLRGAADQTTRITEELDALRERCNIVRDQMDAQQAEIMNRNMLLLSVLSAIFLPLGLIAGMMGMNVGGIPGANDQSGFWILCFILLAIGVVELIIFRAMRWV